jgi:hypothetical protein
VTRCADCAWFNRRWDTTRPCSGRWWGKWEVGFLPAPPGPIQLGGYPGGPVAPRGAVDKVVIRYEDVGGLGVQFTDHRALPVTCEWYNTDLVAVVDRLLAVAP